MTFFQEIVLFSAGLGLLMSLLVYRRAKAILGRVRGNIQLVPSSVQVAADPPQFIRIGNFTCPQIPGVQLSAWWSESDKVAAVAYIYPGRPSWWDVVSYYNQGVTVTWSSMGSTGLDQDPRHPNIHRSDFDLEELIEECLRERPGGFHSIEPNDFVDRFCRSYRDSIEWRLNKGTSLEEIKRVAAFQGNVYSEEMFAFTHKLYQKAEAQARKGLSESERP